MEDFVKAFCAIIALSAIGGFIALCYWGASNPEAIGGFFGQIVHGFTQAVR